MATGQIGPHGERRASAARKVSRRAAPAGFPPPPPREGERSRGDYAYAAIRATLRAGGLHPGQHLREADFAAWLGLSRTPVREAIRRLVAEGLLAKGPWNGVVIAELDAQQVTELYAVRESLEGTAAALAAMQASAAERERLKEIVAAEAKALADPQRLVEINDQLHDALFRAAHNRYLLQSLTTVLDTLGLLKQTTFVLPGSAIAAHRQHVAIVAAIRARDAERAEQEARNHVRDSLKLRLRLMGGEG